MTTSTNTNSHSISKQEYQHHYPPLLNPGDPPRRSSAIPLGAKVKITVRRSRVIQQILSENSTVKQQQQEPQTKTSMPPSKAPPKQPQAPQPQSQQQGVKASHMVPLQKKKVWVEYVSNPPATLASVVSSPSSVPSAAAASTKGMSETATTAPTPSESFAVPPNAAADTPHTAQHYLCVDIESASGCDTDAWIMAVGMCLVNAVSGKVILKERFCISPTPARDRIYHEMTLDQVPEPLRPYAAYLERKTYKEFWSRQANLGVLLGFLADMRPAWEQWTLIRNMIDGIYLAYNHVALVSDCPDFDLGQMSRRFEWVRMHDQVCTNIRFDSQKLTPRHHAYDPSERLRMLPATLREKILSEARQQSPHDHSPENDAHMTAILMVLLDRWRYSL